MSHHQLKILADSAAVLSGLDMATVEKSMIDFGKDCLENGTRYRLVTWFYTIICIAMLVLFWETGQAAFLPGSTFNPSPYALAALHSF